ncbi:MAG TPA: GH25 family lysozyme [Anaerolineaceae bacterium]|nr:GH25 family lysozyme [Anaerolineaceae bacterium]
MRALGVDINQFTVVQKEPDGFERMRRAGVSFVYAQQMQNGVFHPNFQDHWERAGRAGLLRGAYYFWHHDPGFRPNDPDHVDPAIQLLIDHVPPGAELPFMIDFEEPTTVDRTQEIHVFLGTLRKAFKRLVIYTRANWWAEHTHPEPWMKSYDFWLAQYLDGQHPEIATPENPDPIEFIRLADWIELEDHWPRGNFFPDAAEGAFKPRIWQWSGDFYFLPGIGDPQEGAPLDLDWFDGDLNDLRTWARLPPAAADDPGFRLGSDALPEEETTPRVEKRHRRPSPANPPLPSERRPAGGRRRQGRIPMARALGVDLDKNQFVHKEPQKRDGFMRMRRAGVSFAYFQILQRLGPSVDHPQGVHQFESNPNFLEHWERAGEAGLLRGAYYFWNPDPDFRKEHPERVDPAIERLKNMLPNDADLPLMIDIEEKDVEIDGVPRVHDRTLEVSCFLKVAKQEFGRVFVYTRADWWASHTHPEPWMTEFDFWLAKYLDGQSTATAERVSLRDWKQLADHWPQGDFFPQAAPGGREPVMWQWTGDFYFLPGLGRGRTGMKDAVLDIDWFNGDLDALREWAGLEPALENDLGFSLGSDKARGRVV